MTQKEFETRFGQEVTPECFDFANRIYMAAGQMDKDDFVKEWTKHDVRNSDIVSTLACEVEALNHQINNLKEALDGALRLQDDLSYFIADMAHLAFNAIGNGKELRRKAVEVLGKRAYIKYVIAKGYELEQYDREDILHILNAED